MKLKQFSKRSPCYFCGAPGPSRREHAPPQMMFIGFDCSKITVPSCPKHNAEKSIGDRTIITAIITSASQALKNLDKESVHLSSNQITAIKHAEPNLCQAKNEVELQNILIDPPEGLDIPLPYTHLGSLLDEWIKQLTAALIWSVTGHYEPNIKWEDAKVWSPGRLPMSRRITSNEFSAWGLKSREKEQRYAEMTWQSGWSAMPKSYPSDIYSFDLCFQKEAENPYNSIIIFRHRFYENTSVWYLHFKAPQEVTKTLVTALNQKVIEIEQPANTCST